MDALQSYTISSLICISLTAHRHSLGILSTSIYFGFEFGVGLSFTNLASLFFTFVASKLKERGNPELLSQYMWRNATLQSGTLRASFILYISQTVFTLDH